MPVKRQGAHPVSMGIFGRNRTVGDIGITTDIHCHAMPGIDDGAADTDEALAVIRAMREAGIKKIFLSPHFDAGRPDMSQAIMEGLDKLRLSVAGEGIDVELEAHAEYFLGPDMDKWLMQEGKLLCLPGNYLLVEVSMRQENFRLQQMLFEVQDAGYKPILAHPERYMYYSMSTLSLLRRAGCVFQINLLSLCGYYGSAVRQRAETLVKEKMADLFGSDIHHYSQTTILADKTLRKAVEEAATRNAMFD